MNKPRSYFFNGEELTTKEISEKYNIPTTLVYKAFNIKCAPSLQEMLDYRKKLGITDINDYRSCPRPKCDNKHTAYYEYKGVLYTAEQLSVMFNIPSRLIWKAYNDDSKPDLESMILWRKEHGIDDINDYRCISKEKWYRKEKPILKPTIIEQESKEQELQVEKQNKEVFKYSFKQKCVKLNPSDHIGSIFGCYEIVGYYRKGLAKYITIQCLKCGMLHYDMAQSTFYNLIKNKECHCNKLSHYKIIKHLPIHLQNQSFNDNKKDITYYNSYIGYKICGLKITGVLKKENNDSYIFLFNCICPKCNSLLTVKATNLITNTFRHKCGIKEKRRLFKNSSCLYSYRTRFQYKTIVGHKHKEISEDMIRLLQESVSFYTRVYGTESFIDL